MAAVDDYDDEDALALFDFHESRAGELQKKKKKAPCRRLWPRRVRRHHGTAAVPGARRVELLGGHGGLGLPTVDLFLPHSQAVALVGAAARSCGFFQVTNHGIPVGTVESALSAVRAFNEQPLAARSAYYSVSTAGPAVYTTVPIPPRNAGQHANVPLLPWRDTLVLRFGHDKSQLNHLPAACLDALLEYHQSLTALGKVIAGLLSEALGVGSEQLDRAVQVEATLMQCHYYPPCPRLERVVGSRVHTEVISSRWLRRTASVGCRCGSTVMEMLGWTSCPSPVHFLSTSATC
ncbi:1-aminocyclopropane-1-carboxylate oxidase homolog 1-like [Miscanthus floridulus]|uniref:1-aminocyclopropane-1-carboxylate oxidase homolog 1-like n=1 Tax=Miscanthus floridulus TaxID=154761 RepID=UPI00345A5EB0